MNHWHHLFPFLPDTWQRAIETIEANTMNYLQIIPLIPRFTFRQQEVLFWYFVYKDYLHTKKALHCSNDTINLTLKEFSISHSLPEQKKTGRPKKIIERILGLIEQQTGINRHVSNNELKRFLERNSLSISVGTIHAARHMLKFSYKPPKKTHVLTELQKKRRLSFAYTMLTGQHYMEAIIFSDESRICIGPDSRWVWRKYGDTEVVIY